MVRSGPTYGVTPTTSQWTAGGVVGGIGTAVGGTIGNIGRGVATSVGGMITDWAQRRLFGGGGAQGYGPPGPPPPVEPHGPVRRTIEKLLPGGRTGYELQPYGDAVDRLGRPVAVHPGSIERAYVPPGYVVCMMPDGSLVGVLRGVAISMGLWRPRPKPPVTAGDYRAIRRANSARKRVRKLAGQVGFACHARGRGFRKKGGKRG